MSDSRVEIGVTPWLLGDDGLWTGFAAQAERAEALGFHSIFLPEHHFSKGAIPAPLLLLAGAAARTSRIKLGTTSFLLPLRHPLHVAAEVATLDRMSGGRVILGLGRGFAPGMFAAFAVPPKEKRDRFEAALARMRSAWAGEPVAFEDAEQTRPVHLTPLPLQRPHPPLWVAAFGPKALAQAGRLGLPYLASPMEPIERLAENLARHREACAEAGREPPADVPLMRSVFTSRDVGALARATAALEQQLRGLARAPAAALREGAAAALDEWALVGEPEAVAERIAGLQERFGMTHLIARAQIPGLDAKEVEASLELVAELGVC